MKGRTGTKDASKRKRSAPKEPVNDSHFDSQPQPQSQPTTSVPPKTFCDVCWGKPNKQGMIFQQCRSCKVGVHNECYGMSGKTAADANFICHACKAIGSTVTVRQRDRHDDKGSDTRMQFTVVERPTECCLCSVDDTTDWYHAMHPIYDHYGPSGRQMVLPPDKEHPNRRLAWAHTLCCLVVSAHRATGGCIYGCSAQGEYDGEGDDDSNSDTSSVNSALVSPSPHGKADDSIHHFIYCLRLKGQPDNAWTKAIKDQQHLKCHICGSDDRRPENFAIPLQCSANDPDEFIDFQNSHHHLDNDNNTCYMAMHVGCAMWGRNDVGEYPNERRVFFFPGRQKSHVQDVSTAKRVKRGVTKSVTNLFCRPHAEDLVVAKRSGAATVRYPQRRRHTDTASMSQSQPGTVAEVPRPQRSSRNDGVKLLR